MPLITLFSQTWRGRVKGKKMMKGRNTRQAGIVEEKTFTAIHQCRFGSRFPNLNHTLVFLSFIPWSSVGWLLLGELKIGKNCTLRFQKKTSNASGNWALMVLHDPAVVSWFRSVACSLQQWAEEANWGKVTLCSNFNICAKQSWVS